MGEGAETVSTEWRRRCQRTRTWGAPLGRAGASQPSRDKWGREGAPREASDACVRCHRGAPHRRHNVTTEEDYRTALLFDSPHEGCSLSDPVGATSRKRPGHLGRFLPLFQENSVRSSLTTNANERPFAPWGDWARGKETLPAHPPSAGQPHQPANRKLQLLPTQYQGRLSPDIYTQSRPESALSQNRTD